MELILAGLFLFSLNLQGSGAKFPVLIFKVCDDPWRSMICFSCGCSWGSSLSQRSCLSHCSDVISLVGCSVPFSSRSSTFGCSSHLSARLEERLLP